MSLAVHRCTDPFWFGLGWGVVDAGAYQTRWFVEVVLLGVDVALLGPPARRGRAREALQAQAAAPSALGRHGRAVRMSLWLRCGRSPPEGRRGQRDPVMRAFQVLLWMVDAEGSSWGLREIAKGVEMHPSTLYRVLSRLEGGGLIRQDPETEHYGPGPGFLRLVWKAASRDPVGQLAVPYLKQLTHATRETSFLTVYDPVRRQRMYAAAVESPHPLREMRGIGEWLLINAGASGLAILAFRPEHEQREILSQPLVAMTPATITDPAKLEEALQRVRRLGCAVSRGQGSVGTVGVAAPILGPDGYAIAAIAITQPEQRFGPGDERRQTALVTSCTREISALLAGLGRPGTPPALATDGAPSARGRAPRVASTLSAVPQRRPEAGQAGTRAVCRVADGFRPRFPQLAVLLDAAEPDVLAYLGFPRAPSTHLQGYRRPNRGPAVKARRP